MREARGLFVCAGSFVGPFHIGTLLYMRNVSGGLHTEISAFKSGVKLSM